MQFGSRFNEGGYGSANPIITAVNRVRANRPYQGDVIRTPIAAPYSPPAYTPPAQYGAAPPPPAFPIRGGPRLITSVPGQGNFNTPYSANPYGTPGGGSTGGYAAGPIATPIGIPINQVPLGGGGIPQPIGRPIMTPIKQPSPITVGMSPNGPVVGPSIYG